MAFIYDMTDTWNNIATTFTAIKMNVTDTNSAAASLLLDLQVGSTSQFNIGKTGIFTWGATRFVSRTIGQSSDGFYKIGQNGSDAMYLSTNNVATVFFQSNNSDIRIINGSSGTLEWSSSSAPAVVGSIDLIVARDAANTLAQRNGTNAQAFNIYNTYTNSTNYERGRVGFSSNVFRIGPEASGSGTLRSTIIGAASEMRLTYGGGAPIYIQNLDVDIAWVFATNQHFYPGATNSYDLGLSSNTVRTGYFGTSIVSPIATLTQGTITADAPQINGSVTWNNAGVTFTAWKLNVTDSASGGSSLMYDFQKGGTSLQKMDAFGNVTFAAGTITTGTATTAWRIAYDGLTGGSTAPLAWTSGQPTGTKDLFLYRDAANTLALRNSTNAQTFRVYNTESSSLTNYERGNLEWSGNAFTLSTTAAGTGTNRNLGVIAGATLYLGSGTGAQWRISSGNLQAETDNTPDIGASGANRPRSIYLGTMLRTPKLETPRVSELTIATGAITVTGSYHDVDTEADAASDDLDTINGGTDGMRLVMRANNSTRTVVVKDGTGNIQCAGDMSLDNNQDTIELVYDGTLTAWLEISRSDNGA